MILIMNIQCVFCAIFKFRFSDKILI